MEEKNKPLLLRRSSILKTGKARGTGTDEDTEDLIKRRVSFANKNAVKQFAQDPEKNTIWDITYEEVAHNSNQSSTPSTIDGSNPIPDVSMQMQIKEPAIPARIIHPASVDINTCIQLDDDIEIEPIDNISAVIETKKTAVVRKEKFSVFVDATLASASNSMINTSTQYKKRFPSPSKENKKENIVLKQTSDNSKSVNMQLEAHTSDFTRLISSTMIDDRKNILTASCDSMEVIPMDIIDVEEERLKHQANANISNVAMNSTVHKNTRKSVSMGKCIDMDETKMVQHKSIIENKLAISNESTLEEDDMEISFDQAESNIKHSASIASDSIEMEFTNHIPNHILNKNLIEAINAEDNDQVKSTENSNIPQPISNLNKIKPNKGMDFTTNIPELQERIENINSVNLVQIELADMEVTRIGLKEDFYVTKSSEMDFTKNTKMSFVSSREQESLTTQEGENQRSKPDYNAKHILRTNMDHNVNADAVNFNRKNQTFEPIIGESNRNFDSICEIAEIDFTTNIPSELLKENLKKLDSETTQINNEMEVTRMSSNRRVDENNCSNSSDMDFTKIIRSSLLQRELQNLAAQADARVSELRVNNYVEKVNKPCQSPAKETPSKNSNLVTVSIEVPSELFHEQPLIPTYNNFEQSSHGRKSSTSSRGRDSNFSDSSFQIDETQYLINYNLNKGSKVKSIRTIALDSCTPAKETEYKVVEMPEIIANPSYTRGEPLIQTNLVESGEKHTRNTIANHDLRPATTIEIVSNILIVEPVRSADCIHVFSPSSKNNTRSSFGEPMDIGTPYNITGNDLATIETVTKGDLPVQDEIVQVPSEVIMENEPISIGISSNKIVLDHQDQLISVTADSGEENCCVENSFNDPNKLPDEVTFNLPPLEAHQNEESHIDAESADTLEINQIPELVIAKGRQSDFGIAKESTVDAHIPTQCIEVTFNLPSLEAHQNEESHIDAESADTLEINQIPELVIAKGRQSDFGIAKESTVDAHIATQCIDANLIECADTSWNIEVSLLQNQSKTTIDLYDSAEGETSQDSTITPAEAESQIINDSIQTKASKTSSISELNEIHEKTFNEEVARRAAISLTRTSNIEVISTDNHEPEPKLNVHKETSPKAETLQSKRPTLGSIVIPNGCTSKQIAQMLNWSMDASSDEEDKARAKSDRKRYYTELLAEEEARCERWKLREQEFRALMDQQGRLLVAEAALEESVQARLQDRCIIQPTVEEWLEEQRKIRTTQWALQSLTKDKCIGSVRMNRILFELDMEPSAYIITNIDARHTDTPATYKLSRFVDKLLFSKMQDSQIRMAIGARFNLRTFLEYLQLTAESVDVIEVELRKMTVKSLTETFIGFDEDLHLQYCLQARSKWIVTMDIFDINNLNASCIVSIKSDSDKFKAPELEILNIAKKCPKGLKFLNNFIEDVYSLRNTREKAHCKVLNRLLNRKTIKTTQK